MSDEVICNYFNDDSLVCVIKVFFFLISGSGMLFIVQVEESKLQFFLSWEVGQGGQIKEYMLCACEKFRSHAHIIL